MTPKLSKLLVAALLPCVAGLASANGTPIDLFTVAGVPGTGGDTTVIGPCYCDEPAWYSPVMLLQPGTYDFGELRDYWVQSGPTPDGGPDQGNLYLLYSPVETSGRYPDDFFAPPFLFPATALCDQNNAACNALYVGAFVDFDLTYTVQPGQNAAQIVLIGNYRYTAPVPEPLPAAMLLLGLGLITGIAPRRGRR